jgi:signal transduction histidine kinase
VSWLQRLGWFVLAVLTLGAAIAVFVVRLPDPEGALAIDRAIYQADNEAPVTVSLPHLVLPRVNSPIGVARYRAHFDLPAAVAGPLFLYIPTLNRQISVDLNGDNIFHSDAHTVWAGPLIGSAVLLHLPRPLLNAGNNELAVTLDAGKLTLPTYMSRLYIGTEAELSANYKLRTFLEDQLKTMALAAQVLLGIGIICAYFYRPRDTLFAWLAAMVVASFVLSIGMFAGYQQGWQQLMPYLSVLSPVIGFITIGVALAVVGREPPRLLKLLCIAFPVVGSLLAFVSGPSTKTVLILASIPVLILGFVVAAGVVAWGAVKLRSVDARLMLSPFFLVSVVLTRDLIVAANLADRPLVLFTPYVRPLILAFVMAVLMRRLANSLDRLDSANETLNVKLAAREAELAALHRAERLEATRQVREQERERLTRDLHDGISGHLVSIIAMAERGSGDVRPIEDAAREALDDLRLVIYSLELGDSELPLALANFRERLIPQLQRIGVALEWSTADLPEVTGVTPANALIVLRILQEAITNAVKHGPAQRIAVRGAAGEDGMVAITVENDGRAFAEKKTGNGLDNMRRRAAQLRGRLDIVPLPHGAALTLVLPRSLPDIVT